MYLEKINLKNEKALKILTISIYIISVILYEFGICNGHVPEENVQGVSFFHNFSLARIVIYVVFFAVLFKYINIFIKEAIDTFKYKSKKILLAIYIPIAIIIGIYVLICWVSIYKAQTVILALLMGSIFIIYVSSDYIKNVIVTVMTLGIIFTITTDFHHAIDEKKHMMSAVNIANGNFDYVKNPLNEPAYNNIIFNCDIDSFIQFYGKKYEPNLTNEWNRNEDTEIYYICSSPAEYKPILYIPSVAGIIFAKLLGGSIADVYIMGRLFNLIFYAILVIIILKTLPYKQKLFYIIYMIPFTLLISASYSVDGICIGILGIFIAYCLNLSEKEFKTIKLKQILILMGLFMLCLIVKNFAYCTILLFILVLPIFKILKNNKKSLPFLITIILIAILICGIMMVNKFTDVQLSEGDPRGGNTDVSGQINFLVSSPKNIFIVGFQHIANSLLNYNWYTYLNHSTFFGKYSSQIFFLELIFILYVSLTDYDDRISKRVSIVSVLTFFVVYCTTSFMLYLTFTPVGTINITGYQPRYITPVLPIILMIINNKRFNSKNTNDNINIATNINLILGLFTIIDLICLTQIS